MESAAGSRLRDAVRALGRKRRNDAVPLALRRRMVSYAQARRREGRGWGRIAGELGVAGSTLQRWCATPSEPALRPVRVAVPARHRREEVANRASRVVVVTAAGHRIEGLAVADAAALLRALGA